MLRLNVMGQAKARGSKDQRVTEAVERARVAEIANNLRKEAERKGGTCGPCEHKWDGPDWESEDGCACSVTCSLCGCTAMSHDMRNAP